MDIQQQLVAYARIIAGYVGYTNLINGLQPWEILRDKRAHEKLELAEAQETKTPLHVLHEAADVLYYSACMVEQERDWKHPLVISQYRHICTWLKSQGVDPQQAEAAALAKYGWRAAAPGNKDEAYELSLIQEAIGKGKAINVYESLSPQS